MRFTDRARRRRRGCVVLAVAMGVLLPGHSPPAGAAPVPGGAGTDTALPATNSKVTVSGRGRFADLKVTVNQTKNLVNQAVSITWTGGNPTGRGGSGARFGEHYLQVMQCWGEDNGLVPANPGPPPEQCVFGASNGVHGRNNTSLFPPGFAIDRITSQKLWPGFDANDGFFVAKDGWVWKPFMAVDGTVTNAQFDTAFNPTFGGGDYWLNTKFNFITTNEIPGGRTGQNGSGAELFEVNTGVESSGLGCGQAVLGGGAGAAAKIPKCWLVIVPRGSAGDENVGTGAEPSRGVVTSPLSARAWQNRISIPLEFNPVESPCSLADDQRRIVGNELLSGAAASWQPKLCSTPGLPPYAYGIVSDAAARQQLRSKAAGAPGMIVVARPYEPSTLDAASPVVYAPVSLSGLAIGFNIERVPSARNSVPEEEVLRGVRVAQLNLTPRLVAKLLTQSYGAHVAIRSTVPATYEWLKGNATHLGLDRDFLQFNPEFELLENGGKNFAGLVMTSRNSDAARQVWEWLLADPEARAWLDGTPDQWGMKVNPVYATKKEVNSSGAAFGDPVPDSLPKSDPYCYQAPPITRGATTLKPPLLCGTDWLPYAPGLREAAQRARAADDGARTDLDVSAEAADRVYRPDGPLTLGSRTILAMTDTASAARYGLQTARLSRAGDNRPDRAFNAPDTAGLTAGAESMAAKSEPTVLEPAPLSAKANAYPLTTLSYAVTAPLTLDEKSRREYAAFVDYASSGGQVAGRELGQLPQGYAPLPEKLRAQGAAAAKTILELKPAATPATEPATPAPGAGTPALGPSAQSPSPSSLTADGGGGSFGSTSSSSGSAGETMSGSASATTAPPATTTVTATSPTAAAVTAPPRSTVLTPVVALAGTRLVLPAILGVALLSSLGALEISKRPRAGASATGSAATRRRAAQADRLPLAGVATRWRSRP